MGVFILLLITSISCSSLNLNGALSVSIADKFLKTSDKSDIHNQYHFYVSDPIVSSYDSSALHNLFLSANKRDLDETELASHSVLRLTPESYDLDLVLLKSASRAKGKRISFNVTTTDENFLSTDEYFIGNLNITSFSEIEGEQYSQSSTREEDHDVDNSNEIESIKAGIFVIHFTGLNINLNPPCSVETVQKVLWDWAGKDHISSGFDYFTNLLHGSKAFTKDITAKLGKPDIFGPIKLSMKSSWGCETNAWLPSVLKAISDQNIDVSSYVIRTFVVNYSCPFVGLATLGCYPICDTWVLSCDAMLDVLLHEYGHHFGLQHSNSDVHLDGHVVEYGDPFALMANGWQDDPFGWYPFTPADLISLDIPLQVETISGNTNIKIGPLENRFSKLPRSATFLDPLDKNRRLYLYYFWEKQYCSSKRLVIMYDNQVSFVHAYIADRGENEVYFHSQNAFAVRINSVSREFMELDITFTCFDNSINIKTSIFMSGQKYELTDIDSFKEHIDFVPTITELEPILLLFEVKNSESVLCSAHVLSYDVKSDMNTVLMSTLNTNQSFVVSPESECLNPIMFYLDNEVKEPNNDVITVVIIDSTSNVSIKNKFFFNVDFSTKNNYNVFTHTMFPFLEFLKKNSIKTTPIFTNSDFKTFSNSGSDYFIKYTDTDTDIPIVENEDEFFSLYFLNPFSSRLDFITHLEYDYTRLSISVTNNNFEQTELLPMERALLEFKLTNLAVSNLVDPLTLLIRVTFSNSYTFSFEVTMKFVPKCSYSAPVLSLADEITIVASGGRQISLVIENNNYEESCLDYIIQLSDVYEMNSPIIINTIKYFKTIHFVPEYASFDDQIKRSFVLKPNSKHKLSFAVSANFVANIDADILNKNFPFTFSYSIYTTDPSNQIGSELKSLTLSPKFSVVTPECIFGSLFYSLTCPLAYNSANDQEELKCFMISGILYCPSDRQVLYCLLTARVDDSYLCVPQVFAFTISPSTGYSSIFRNIELRPKTTAQYVISFYRNESRISNPQTVTFSGTINNYSIPKYTTTTVVGSCVQKISKPDFGFFENQVFIKTSQTVHICKKNSAIVFGALALISNPFCDSASNAFISLSYSNIPPTISIELLETIIQVDKNSNNPIRISASSNSSNESTSSISLTLTIKYESDQQDYPFQLNVNDCTYNSPLVVIDEFSSEKTITYLPYGFEKELNYKLSFKRSDVTPIDSKSYFTLFDLSDNSHFRISFNQDYAYLSDKESFETTVSVTFDGFSEPDGEEIILKIGIFGPHTEQNIELTRRFVVLSKEEYPSPVSRIVIHSYTPEFTTHTAHILSFSGCENLTKCSCPCTYYVYCNGELITKLTDKKHYVHRRIRANQQYNYHVIVHDKFGQTSLRSCSDTISFIGQSADLSSFWRFLGSFFIGVFFSTLVAALSLVYSFIIRRRFYYDPSYHSLYYSIKRKFSHFRDRHKQKKFIFGETNEKGQKTKKLSEISLKNAKSEKSLDTPVHFFTAELETFLKPDELREATRRMHLNIYTPEDIDLLIHKGGYSLNEFPIFIQEQLSGLSIGLNDIQSSESKSNEEQTKRTRRISDIILNNSTSENDPESTEEMKGLFRKEFD